MVMNGSLINKIGGLRMNERERFEDKYPNEKNASGNWATDLWIGWQARAEIAKQDEKELIKALKYYANNQHVTKYIRQGKEFIEVENGEIATKALEKLNG